MATLLNFRPSIQACPSLRHRKPDSNRRRSSSTKWWTPLFGWSSDPDYIDDDATSVKSINGTDPDVETTRGQSRFAPGCFTEEKAKRLRMMTTETAAFHDIMYHSATASRLASDLSDRSGR